jgi:hypothetical protein
MGRASRMRKAVHEQRGTVPGQKIIHTKKNFPAKGVVDTYREITWGNKRCLCGREADIRIWVWGEEQEVVKRAQANPMFALQVQSLYGGNTPVGMETSSRAGYGGKFIRVSETFACASCRKIAEKEAAKAPGWCFVEIDDVTRFARIQA